MTNAAVEMGEMSQLQDLSAPHAARVGPQQLRVIGILLEPRL